jgi:hypothetical protein
VARATGLSRTTWHNAVRELEGHEVPPERAPKAGGKKVQGGTRSPAGEGIRTADADQLERLVNSGDASPLRWSSKSTAKLAEEAAARG